MKLSVGLHPVVRRLCEDTASLLRAYAAILFSDQPMVGALFLTATFWYPNAGASGLVGAFVGLLTARLLAFPGVERGLYVYNSLLLGLALGIAFRLDPYLIVLILMGAVLAVLLTVASTDILWRLGRLPVLSLPFVIAAFTCFFAAQGYGNLRPYLAPALPIDPFLGELPDAFLIALGSSFFIPHPIPGLLFLLGVMLTSRYLVLLGGLGFLVGFGVLHWLTGTVHPYLGQWGGFNFILTAMAVGGIFTVPGWHSLLVAVVAAALASLVTMAVQGFLLVYGLPVLAIPFLLTTLTVLTALGKRQSLKPPHLLLETPALPEKNYERARLARARGFDPVSVPLAAPFFGAWQVYQGFDGRHTHRPPWQHALDFLVTESGRSYRGDGRRLTDYYCYDLPVLSPCHGTVVRCRGDLPDHPPGEVDREHNWGNFVLIALPNGLYVLLAHLRQHSLQVAEGAVVVPGQPLARCGNTGRSPQPHLHLHVQTSAMLGSPTHPFHLVGVAVQKSPREPSTYRLAHRPVEGEVVSVVKPDAALRRRLHLPVGLQMGFRWRIRPEPWRSGRLTVTLDLLGCFHLCSDSGASACFAEEGHVLCFYDRNPKPDLLLDLWLLALGLTPLVEEPLRWQDQPSDRLLPLPLWGRLLRALRRPLGGGLDSRYHRTRGDRCWLQEGEHCLRLRPGLDVTATTQAHIDMDGRLYLMLKTPWLCIEAELVELATQKDMGIPATKIPL